MKTKIAIAAALASVFAVTAAAPSFAAGDPAKHQKRIHRMIHRADTNGDRRVSPAEMEAALAKSFAVLDTNHDGVLSKSEVENRRETYKAYRLQVKAERKAGQHLARVIRLKGLSKHFAKVDGNGDGVISKSEIAGAAEQQFKRRDRNGDGYISIADFKA
jgi:hypothetical protein